MCFMLFAQYDSAWQWRTIVSKCLVIIWLMRAFQNCLRYVHCTFCTRMCALFYCSQKWKELKTSSKNHSKFPAKKYKNVIKLNQSSDIFIIHFEYKYWHVQCACILRSVFTFVRFQINLKQTWSFVIQEIKIKITTLKWFFYRTQCALIFQNESAAASLATLVRARATHARTLHRHRQNVLDLTSQYFPVLVFYSVYSI